MLRTVVNQTYTGNLAVDSSGFFNHGVPVQVAASHPGFAFSQPGSRINVKPSASLSTLGCINVEVGFTLSPRGSAHRYNLAEGFLSFALFVNPDLSLQGTIVDDAGNWTGAVSAAGIVSPATTHVAGLQCDGVSMVRLLLDGQVVGANYGVYGEVRGIGALGLAIGHWPDPPDQYTFEGTILGALLQKYEPQGDLSLIDPCCFDRDALAAWFRAMARKGVTRAQLVQASQALQTATRAAVVAVRGGDAARTEQHHALTASLLSALKRHDCGALEEVLKQLLVLAERVPGPERSTLADGINQALNQFGLSAADWNRLMSVLCLSPCDCGKKGPGNGH
jgi:hypothetical protein